MTKKICYYDSTEQGRRTRKKSEPVCIYEIGKTVKSVWDRDAASHKETALHSYAEKVMQCHEAQEKWAVFTLATFE